MKEAILAKIDDIASVLKQYVENNPNEFHDVNEESIELCIKFGFKNTPFDGKPECRRCTPIGCSRC